jgi:hypothetical protein
MHMHIHMRAGFLIIFIRVSPGGNLETRAIALHSLAAPRNKTPKQQYNSNGMVGSWLMGGAGARGYKIGATWACGLPAAYFLEDVLFDFAPYK